MTVIKSSVFPASKEKVYEKLQKLELLQHIAWPYATFTPVGDAITVWQEGTTSSYKFKLFGFIPFGTHKISVITFDIDKGIYTHEGNEHVPVWNHRIVLNGISETQCFYSDIVEIGAGWKTLFVWLWANCFCAHRQRKWIKLLEKNDSICIKLAETDEELCGRGYVHCTAWQEAYRGIVCDQYLDTMSVEATTARARQFPENTLVAKDKDKVVGFAVYGPSRDEDLPSIVRMVKRRE